MRLLTRIETYPYLLKPVVGNGDVWLWWDSGVKRVIPGTGKIFQFSFPVSALPIAVGSNGKNVLACYEDRILYSDNTGIGMVVPKSIPNDLLTVSPYCHDCFSPYQEAILECPTYWYQYGEGSASADMAVGAHYAVLADFSCLLIKIGSGNKLLGHISLPSARKAIPLVCNLAVGYVSHDHTVVITPDACLFFKAIGGMGGNVLVLFVPGTMCAIDLLSQQWTALSVPSKIGWIERIIVCPAEGKYHVVCLEEADGGCNVWAVEIPPMNEGRVREIPIQYTVKLPPFRL